MNLLKNRSASPIFLALEHLKVGDNTSAYKQLGITAEQADTYDFLDSIIAFEKGLELLLSGSHTESVEYLNKAIPLIEITTDDEAKFLVPTLANFAKGVSCLFSGDTHRAHKLLKLSNDSIERISFFIPDFEKTSLYFKATADMALAKIYISIGDIKKGENIYGKINQTHKKLLLKLDENNEDDFPIFNEIYATRVEFSLLLMRLDIESFDFTSLDQRVKYSKIDILNLKKFINKIPDNPTKEATEIISILFEVFEIYALVGTTKVAKRKPFNKKDIQNLLEVNDKLFHVRQKANNADERGKLYLYTINQLNRLQKNILEIGKVQKKDFGRSGGLIALVALLLQIIVVDITIKPEGSLSILYYFGEVIISLIVGFGYEALRFKPLLALYANVLKREEKDSK